MHKGVHIGLYAVCLPFLFREHRETGSGASTEASCRIARLLDAR